MNDAPQRLRFDEFELDEANALLTRAGQQVPLPPKTFSLLCTLARRPGQLTKKDLLLDTVWGHRHVSESVLKTTISQLRAALADDATKPRYVETVSRLGYRFIGSIETGPQSTAVSKSPQTKEPHSSSFDATLVRDDAHALVQPLSPMIGRAQALAQLREAWRGALAGQRQVVWVVGDAGVGKSTLIENFVREIQPVAVVHGQCAEQYGAGEPYRPVLEALGALCRKFPDLPALMRTVAPTWLVQFPWLASEADLRSLQRDLSGVHQDRMVRELAELMGRFTQDRPLLFVCEDLHWSDQGTLRLLDHCARRVDPVRLLWLSSFRLTQVVAEDHPLLPLRQELRLHKLCKEIALDPFSQSEVADYLASRIPDSAVPEDFIHRLHVHTDGLPLFVANVIDILVAQEERENAASAPWLQETASTPLPVPDNLTGAIERQIARLPAETCMLLEAASVCGMEFRVGTLAEVLQKDASWTGERCDRLTRDRYWLREAAIVELPNGAIDTRIVFRHALYRHAFYLRLGSAQRATYHRRVAQAIEKDLAMGFSATPAELASHYERGHAPMAALRCYARATQSALAHFAPQEAESLTAHALTLLPRCPEGPERLEVELALLAPGGLAAAQLHGIGSPQASACFERIRVICEILPLTPQRALLLSGLGWVLYARGEFGKALALAERILALAESHNDKLLLVCACNLLGPTLATQGDHIAGCEWLERGIAACKELGELPPLTAFLVDPEVSMHAVICLPLLNRGLVDAAREHAAKALERADRIGQPMARALARRSAAQFEVRLMDATRVALLAAELGKIVEEFGVAQPAGPALWLRGWAEAQLGNACLGHRHIMEGYNIFARLGMFATCTEAFGHAAEAQILLSNWDAAREDLNQGLKLAERTGERMVLPDLLLLQSRIALGRGDTAAARKAIEESLAEAQRQQALEYELKAQWALATLSKESQDLDALAAVYGRLPGSKDTKLRIQVGELLSAHGRTSS